eukprot:TRINITY_DN59092_c0_g1_i1.p1 TRINITY_DN59092_c0_g1~~TRINITY_DN59092_c0_g1_i1.p1  ORF type:complete len:910 (+),score=136.50 TRINITY_DN59092_c0_g1_i1:148-2877(+)
MHQDSVEIMGVEAGSSTIQRESSSFRHTNRSARRRAAGCGIRLISSEACMQLRSGLVIYMLVVSWIGLYKGILFRDPTPYDLKEFDFYSSDLIFFLSIVASALLVIDAIIIWFLGAFAYGRAMTQSWLVALQAFSIYPLGLLLAIQILADHYVMPNLYLLVPAICSMRLHMAPMFNDHIRLMGETERRLQGKTLDANTIRKAIKSVPGLAENEKRVLVQLVADMEKPVESSSGSGIAETFQARKSRRASKFRNRLSIDADMEESTWHEGEFWMFQRDAHQCLVTCGLDKRAADFFLLQIVKAINGHDVAKTVQNTYGVWQTTFSGIGAIWRFSRPEFISYGFAVFAESALVPAQAALVQWTIAAASAAVKADALDDVEGKEEAKGVALRCIIWYMVLTLIGIGVDLARSYAIAGVISTTSMGTQRLVGERMANMGEEDEQVWSNSNVTTVFSSDMKELDKFLKGIMNVLLGPAMKLTVSMFYVTAVMPKIGILMWTMLPFVFTTIPQERPSQASAAKSKANAKCVAVFASGLQCQELIWTTDGQSKWLQQFMDPALSDLKAKAFSNTFWGNVVQTYVVRLIQVYVALQIGIFSWLATQGYMSIAEFTGMLSLFKELGVPASKFGNYFKQASDAAGSMQRIDDFTSLESTDSSTSSSVEHRETKGLESGAGKLVLDEVSFTYTGATEPTLSNISLQLQERTFAVVVGPSGCGLSSMIRLLTTRLTPSLGSIRFRNLVYDALADSHTAQQLRREISLLTRDSQILCGSVHDNIAFSSSDVGAAEVHLAADMADLDLSNLPSGFDTQLGLKGAPKLGKEQMLRLCLARALCRKPSLLLLDESTASLDPEVENSILTTIKSLPSDYPEEFGSLIVISTSHKQDTLRYADTVIRMAKGGTSEVSYGGASSSSPP